MGPNDNEISVAAVEYPISTSDAWRCRRKSGIVGINRAAPVHAASCEIIA
jgi:hypothetical protein